MPRLVVLSSRRLLGNINDPIHRGFIEAYPGEVCWVGPGERCAPASDLAKQVGSLKPDLVLVNMKKRVQDWLRPEQIARIEAPTVMLEVDYCFEPNDDWYLAAQFTRVFLRGKSDVGRTTMKHVRWIPFSVHPSWICPADQMGPRKQVIGFAGTVTPVSNYPVRARALEVLEAAGIKATPRGKQRGEDYMKFWRAPELGLTCTSLFRYENAKHVIIPAAGALLLTDGSPGLPELLPPEAYALYQPDGSDLLDLIRELTRDREALLHRRQIARAHIEKHHTHERRWQQILESVAMPA